MAVSFPIWVISLRTYSLVRTKRMHLCKACMPEHFCVPQRKKTLLVEYRQLRKANAFVDRRFGEEDESLTAEEKAIARFQKQRMKEFGGKPYKHCSFASEPTITHSHTTVDSR